jgi:hypothetical protein
LSTAGNGGTSSVGLVTALYDGQQVTIRNLQNIKFNKNIAINFEGRVKFQLLIKNNAASMLLAYLK